MARFEVEKDEIFRNFNHEKEKWAAEFDSAVKSEISNFIESNKADEEKKIKAIEKMLKTNFAIQMKQQENESQDKIDLEREKFSKKLSKVKSEIPSLLTKIRQELEAYKSHQAHFDTTMKNFFAAESLRLSQKSVELLKLKENEFNLERNKHKYEKMSLEKALEALSSDFENIQNEKRCLEADRESLRKHYRDFVQLMRPDLTESQSGSMLLLFF